MELSDRNKILLAEYKEVTRLYSHEDNLCWTKVNHFSVISSILFAAFAFLKDANSMQLIIGFIGIFLSVGWFITISRGYGYLNYYNTKAQEIQKQLIINEKTILSIFPQNDENIWPKKIHTEHVAMGIPVGLAILWALLCTYLLVNIVG